MKHASHHTSLAPLLVAPVLVALLAGCGLQNPNTVSLGSTNAKAHAPISTRPTARRTRRMSPSRPQPRPVGADSPRVAITRWAALWCDWSTSDLIAHERKLERLSVGGARAQEQAALATPAEHGTHITNTCTIEALAQGAGNAEGQWVLVTSSRTTTPAMQAAAPQFHVTYIRLARRDGRYRVSQWAPRS